jgi:hypothetical protein
MSTYFGGRSEVRIRLAPQEVIHTDFRSQYTTVNALMKLQDLLLAERISLKRSDPETKLFLQGVTIGDLQKRENWERLRGIALVVPENDILPLRTIYAPHGGTNIGVNCVTSRLPVWVTFADCLASKFLNGGNPSEFLGVGARYSSFLAGGACLVSHLGKLWQRIGITTLQLFHLRPSSWWTISRAAGSR